MKKTKKQKIKEKCVKLAMDNYLAENTICEYCGSQSEVAHHFIHQSRSNYLRTEKSNLVALCKRCHMKVHNGYEQILTGLLIERRGKSWFNKILSDSTKTIKDSIIYWEEKFNELEKGSY